MGWQGKPGLCGTRQGRFQLLSKWASEQAEFKDNRLIMDLSLKKTVNSKEENPMTAMTLEDANYDKRSGYGKDRKMS